MNTAVFEVFHLLILDIVPLIDICFNHDSNIKHDRNLSVELEKGRQVALFALKTKSRSSKDVKHIGLKSAISNQILKKYSSNKKLKRISSVKLTVPSQSIKFVKGQIKIPCLKLEIDFQKNKEGIVLEDLKDIRKTAKTSRKNRYALNSWSFYQLKTFIEYKAKLHGVPVAKIDPRYTSQTSDLKQVKLHSINRFDT